MMYKIPGNIIVFYFVTTLCSCSFSSHDQGAPTPSDSLAFKEAYSNGVLANEGFYRCRRFVNSWLEHADPTTGLIPRNLYDDIDIWNAKDAAADNYPFMVLTAALTDQELFQGRMLDMLEKEIQLSSRIDNLPDTYSFTKRGFENPDPNLDDIMFGSSEYVKDGLLPLTEWLGPSPWSERMIQILDDMWKYASIETQFGKIVSTNVELNGEMLQTLSRIYWMTGDQKYLDWAIRLGDYFLLTDQHPTRDFPSLRLRDHGCEIVSGLCELYVTLSVTDIAKKTTYQPHVHEMLSKILEVGRNDDGLFYNSINPQTGEVLNSGIADNFGYTLNGFYSVYLVDSVQEYRNAVLKSLGVLNSKYRNFDWERGSSDGYADAIEGALNLYSREQVESTASWLDSEVQVMWSMQDSSYRSNALRWQSSGVIEGWHGDGNFARTTIMYCLWKTQGVTAMPWRDDILLGAVRRGEDILISVTVEADWEGVLKFDSPRHKSNMGMPRDWPRINQFPEWFTVDENLEYLLQDVKLGTLEEFTSTQLSAGVKVLLGKGTTQFVLKSTKKG